MIHPKRLLSIAKPKINHAVVSAMDLFSVSYGPSSSHTTGVNRATNIFCQDLQRTGLLAKVSKLRIDLYGSLALTGYGHRTDWALLCGFEGNRPETVDPKVLPSLVERVKSTKKINFNGHHVIDFDFDKDVTWRYNEVLKGHSNGMRFSVFDKNGDLLATAKYLSVGGGFVVNEATSMNQGENAYFKDKSPEEINQSLEQQDHIRAGDDSEVENRKSQSHVSSALPFGSGEELLQLCKDNNLSIAQIVFKNELRWRTAELIRSELLHIWSVMDQSIMNGLLNDSGDSHLPGDLKVKIRAPGLYRRLISIHKPIEASSEPVQKKLPDIDAKVMKQKPSSQVEAIKDKIYDILPSSESKQKSYQKSLPAVDWLSVYAIAVNEQNALSGRIVTAPTNGAAGIIPSVLKYFLEFISKSSGREREDEIIEFLLTATAFGCLSKRYASLSAAEAGCQAEVGVACSMSSAGLVAVLGGNPQQVEQAAEIALEHNLGLTCDAIQGLVQIPCIERNALGAVKSVASAQLALASDGQHNVTFDQVLETMRQTGLDMSTKYKETALGGLAVNVPLC